MTATRTARASLVTDLETALGSSWTVYAQPPETVSSPALVIGPRDPYLQRITARQYELLLRLSLLIPRAAGADAMDILDDALDAIRPAVLESSNVTWSSVGGLGITTDAGVPYLIATVDIALAYAPGG